MVLDCVHRKVDSDSYSETGDKQFSSLEVLSGNFSRYYLRIIMPSRFKFNIYVLLFY